MGTNVDGGILKFVDGKATVTLYDGQSITIENIIAGTRFKVIENEANMSDYKTTVLNEENEITMEEAIAVFKNIKNVAGTSNTSNTQNAPLTGDTAHPLFWVILAVIVPLAVVIMLRKKRLFRNEE